MISATEYSEKRDTTTCYADAQEFILKVSLLKTVPACNVFADSEMSANSFLYSHRVHLFLWVYCPIWL